MLFIQTSLTHIHRTLLPNPSPYSPFDEMGIFNITLIGIQSKAKDLKNTKWALPRFIASWHYATNDKIEARWRGWRVETPTFMYIKREKTRLDKLANTPRLIGKFAKEFSSKHQEVFQKVLHLFKKVLSSISMIIFSSYTFLFRPPLIIFAINAKISCTSAWPNKICFCSRFALSLHRKKKYSFIT